jgi:hypothetical protein
MARLEGPVASMGECLQEMKEHCKKIDAELRRGNLLTAFEMAERDTALNYDMAQPHQDADESMVKHNRTFIDMTSKMAGDVGDIAVRIKASSTSTIVLKPGTTLQGFCLGALTGCVQGLESTPTSTLRLTLHDGRLLNGGWIAGYLEVNVSPFDESLQKGCVMSLNKNYITDINRNLPSWSP